MLMTLSSSLEQVREAFLLVGVSCLLPALDVLSRLWLSSEDAEPRLRRCESADASRVSSADIHSGVADSLQNTIRLIHFGSFFGKIATLILGFDNSLANRPF